MSTLAGGSPRSLRSRLLLLFLLLGVVPMLIVGAITNARNIRALEALVADEGPGIPDDLRERIFDPFVTTRDAGNGFGLVLATRAIEAHRGSLALRDSDAGAHFEIRLPRDGVRPPRIGDPPNGMEEA